MLMWKGIDFRLLFNAALTILIVAFNLSDFSLMPF